MFYYIIGYIIIGILLIPLTSYIAVKFHLGDGTSNKIEDETYGCATTLCTILWPATYTLLLLILIFSCLIAPILDSLYNLGTTRAKKKLKDEKEYEALKKRLEQELESLKAQAQRELQIDENYGTI